MIPGVGDIRNLGASEYAMRVWLEARRADAPGDDGLATSRTLVRTQNVVNPAGQVGAEPAPPGQQTHVHRTRPGTSGHEPEEFGER